MTDVFKKSRKVFTATVVAATMAWSIGLSALVAPLTARAAVTSGQLVKASLPAVYYVGADGKRYVFPNEKTYKTWYADFSTVVTITDAELATLQIGGNVTYRPGVKIVKITTDPKVYAVAKGGSLRWVKSEALAVSLYGADWNTADTQDVPDAFFTNYTIGADINSASDFSPSGETATAASINTDKGLGTIAGALSVSLAADNSASSTIISDGTAGVAGSQGMVGALKLDLTSAAGTTAKLTGLKLKRLGVSADSDVDNAYLYDGSTLLAEMTSLSSGVVTFSGLSWSVTGTKSLWVKFDLNRDATAGKTVGFGVNAASDVTLDGGATAGGNYPLNGNLHTVAAVGDFGRLTVALGAATSTTVDPNTSAFEAMRFTLASANQDVKVSYLRLKALGSINSTDLADFKLFDGATQLGSTVASLDADKFLVFDLTASPLTITSGVTKTMSVRVTVKGGSTRTIQLSFQKNYDVRATDGNYNVGLVPDTGTIGTFSVINSTQATVNSGSLTVSLSSSSPQGNVALNATNVLIAKYDLKAVGEGIKVSSLIVQVSSDSFAGATNWTNLRNVRLLYNGSQVGTTQSALAEDTATTVTVNFTVAAGTTGTVEIRSDVAAASGAANAVANTETIQARLNTGTANGQRTESLGTVAVPAANTAGNNLTVASGSLAVAVNTSVGGQTVVQSQTNVRVGSYLLTAGSSEGVDVSSIVLSDVTTGGACNTNNGTTSLGGAFTNLTLKRGGVAIAPVVVPNSADAAGTDYTFSPSPALSVDASQAVQVDLYADVLSNANASWTDGDRSCMGSSTGTGKVTGTSVSGTANVSGQNITVQTGGTLVLSVDSSSPIATQHVMGTTGKTLGIYKFEATNVEDITISQIIANNTNAAGSATFNNLKLYVGGVQVGLAVPAFNGSNNATFSGLSILTPRAGAVLVTLKGDVVSVTDGATSNAFETARLALPAAITGVGTDTVIARGASGAFPSTTATNADAASQYPFAATLTASVACSGSCSGRTRATSDIIGKLSLTGDGVQIRQAMQYNDDTDDGTALSNNWTAVAAGNANTVAADTAISVDGNSISWTATTDFDVDDLLIADLPAATDLSGYSRVSFWLYSTEALTTSDDLAFMVNDAADTTTTSQRTLGAFAATTWTYVDIAMPTSRAVVAADDFFGLRVLSTGELTTTAVKFDEVRFYNDSINIDVTGNLCDTDANCVAEDGNAALNVPTGVPVTFRDSGGTTRGVGYYTGTATTGTVTLFMGADVGAPTGAQTVSSLTPSAGLLSLGATAQVFDLVSDTSQLVDSDSTSTEVLALSLDLGNPSSAGDFRWWDQNITATTPVTWLNGSTPISVSLGY